MKTKKVEPRPKARLETGAAILAAAKVVDVTVIKPRMTAFASAHRSYAAAQSTVDAAETELRKGRAHLARCDAVQDVAVEGLARALVADGQPRANPFAEFETGSPFAVKKLSGTEQAKTIRTLVDLIRESKTAGMATRRAAQAAEQAVGAVAAARLTMATLEATLRTARDMRTAVGQMWDNTLAALKRGARAAADDGAPGLHEALFGGLRRRRSKTAKAAPAPSPPAAPASSV